MYRTSFIYHSLGLYTYKCPVCPAVYSIQLIYQLRKWGWDLHSEHIVYLAEEAKQTVRGKYLPTYVDIYIVPSLILTPVGLYFTELTQVQYIYIYTC